MSARTRPDCRPAPTQAVADRARIAILSMADRVISKRST
jgi:hypothetical protein